MRERAALSLGGVCRSNPILSFGPLPPNAHPTHQPGFATSPRPPKHISWALMPGLPASLAPTTELLSTFVNVHGTGAAQ
eukprot:359108-Chlamydomonas_euryale.AAC.7